MTKRAKIVAWAVAAVVLVGGGWIFVTTSERNRAELLEYEGSMRHQCADAQQQLPNECNGKDPIACAKLHDYLDRCGRLGAFDPPRHRSE